MKLLQKILLSSIIGASSLFAHSLWINSFESSAHGVGHSMVSLGWGHVLPMGDKLNSVKGRVKVDSFNFYDPSLNKFELYTPTYKPAKTTIENKNFDVYKADLATQKIDLKKESQKGVYQLEAKSIPTFYTIYLDEKNRKRTKLKSKDKIKNLKKSLVSIKYQGFAKSYLTIDKWEKPQPLGHDLEITPLTDLSDLRVGDLVEFYFTFKGKPISHGPKGIKYATFWSNTYGQSDGFNLMSKIKKGKAQIRIPTSGQWIVNVYDMQKVTKDGVLKELYGKTDTLMNGASITFNVK